jgi:CoA:oxalate CoA-transferase
MEDQALSGITVLDLSEDVSGAYCTKLLGAFGADVIKVERPDGGDPARNVGPFLKDDPDPECSALFLYLNTNKKSITLDFKTSTGIRILKDLITGIDILVEGFQPGAMAELGLDYASLKEINPGLVMASIADFGQSGPYRYYKGGRLVLNALSGYMFVNGEPGREPLAAGGEQPAYQGGLHAYTGIMAALIHRENTGKGQYIDISQMECMSSLHQFVVNRYEYSGNIQQRVGNRYAHSHPASIYPCKDGYISVNTPSLQFLEPMLTLMELEHMLEDPRFETPFHCLANADAFDAMVLPWFRDRTRKEIIEVFQEWRVPAAYVNNVEDLLNDDQYKARDFWTDIDHPEAGMLPYASAPYHMSETPTQPERAPLLGEHNEVVFGELGLSREDLVRLRSAEVI